jgi:hypothetical protein
MKRVILSTSVFFFAIFIISGCAPSPDIQPEPEIKPSTPAPPSFSMKPYHEDMLAEMRVSFIRADEIILGVYSGSYDDEQIGLVHYFENFKSFDKTTMSWGPVMKVIVQVQAQELNPEIIKRNEFPQLSDLDKVGICWDFVGQVRYVYLVEGQKMLIFLQTGYDEMNRQSYRNLIDAYPVTPVCLAKNVFDLMIRDLSK